jgi:hypothetical protein
MRILLVAGIMLFGSTGMAAEQPPQDKDKFFESKYHDFGTVPRGAQLLHQFKWVNPEKTRLEITDLKASCGCAAATALPRVLEPGQKGVIEVLVDAKKFIGEKKVHVQVTINGERTEAATLELTAHSRPDIVYNPGEVNFGVVAAGASATLPIEIEYAGQLDWRIEELINQSPSLEARYEETYRKSGQAGYRIQVSLKPDVPAGDFKHELQLRTSDPSARVIPVLVLATIRARLLASPSPTYFGTVKEKQTTTRRIVLRADKPFQITKIEGLSEGLTASKSASPALVQTLTLSWTPEAAGELNAQLTITTDLDSHGTITIPVHGQAGGK